MPLPPHVPAELAVDFDFYRPPGGESDPFEALKRLHQLPDLFWTPHHGGHWVATRGEDIRVILTTPEAFSSRHAFIPKSDRPPIFPLEIDPPEHEKYRNLLVAAFTPPAVADWSGQARELAASLIDGFQARGECEFVADFAQQLPIVIFLRMCGLPAGDREMLLKVVAAAVRPGPAVIKEANRVKLHAYIHDLIAARRAEPGEDMVSRALNADVGGRKLDDREAFGLVHGLIGAGLDTVASSMAWIARFLAENPEHRRQLTQDPGLIPRAIDELMRRYSVPNIARVVREDMTYKGVRMKAGEQILLPACLLGLDERTFNDPMNVDFHRPDARMHCAFSLGAHRCPGGALTLQELRIFLQEWLARIPEFSIKPGAKIDATTGIVHGIVALPLVWKPA